MGDLGLFSPTMGLLDTTIKLRARNQAVIAGNVANAETPGYAPARLEFERELARAAGAAPRPAGASATHPGHLPFRGAAESIQGVQGRVVRAPAGVVGRDQNGVALEAEMAAMATNELKYNAAVQLLNKQLEGLKTAIKESQ